MLFSLDAVSRAVSNAQYSYWEHASRFLSIFCMFQDCVETCSTEAPGRTFEWMFT